MTAQSDLPDAHALIRRLGALLDPAMRATSLAHTLKAAPAGDAAWLLEAISSLGRGGDVASARALQAAIDALRGDVLDSETRANISSAARHRQFRECIDLLGADASAQPKREPRRGPPQRGWTLGARREAARGWRRDLLEQLLLDPDPVIAGHLLTNPRITQRDVLRICSSVRATADVLELVARSRHARAAIIRRAIAYNANARDQTALGCIAQLTAHDLRDLARDERLSLVVRTAAFRRLRESADA